MTMISNLEPKCVFKQFEKIASIPHGSGNEAKLSDYIADFAKKLNLEVHQDKMKNIIIKKAATKGYENKAPIILQGHMDMVCDKTADSTHDFEKDGLELLVEGDFLTANKTTLGGDDGIAVAYILAILESTDIPHPALEAIITVSEEIGLDGAKEIDLSLLNTNQLINIDSEEEGNILTSCAGGCRMHTIFPATWEKTTGTELKIDILGLLGGHSGVEIDQKRANANVTLARILRDLPVDYSISSLRGGSKDNVIANNATATIIVKTENTSEVENFIANCDNVLKSEYQVSDPDITLTVENLGNKTVSVLTKELQNKFIIATCSIPDGILAMSQNIEGLVETSLNFGVLTLTKESLTFHHAVRSSVDSVKNNFVARIKAVGENLGATVELTGIYPAWAYKANSPLRENMISTFKELYGHKPIIKAIHAGLECGLFSDKIPNLDAVSIGPDMIGVHTANEKLSIPSTKRVWEYLLKVLENAK